MKFLVDNQLPPALARLIQHEFNMQALHVADVGLQDASDFEIWTYASTNALILVSKDEDFVYMALRAPNAGLIWVRIGNCRRVFLLDVFRKVWSRVIERLESGDRFIEIR